MDIAIVTGASSGLGREFVHLLAAQEPLQEIWVIARRADRLAALQQAGGVKIRPLPLDLTDKAAVRSLAALLGREKPRVRVLINAAGFGRISSAAELPLEDAEGMIDLNCRAAVAVTQVALPYLGAGSRVLQICSTAAFQPFPYLSVYAASKAFLYRYTRALRVELRARQITVTAVCPYWIKDTEFIAGAQKTPDAGAIRSFPFAQQQRTVALRALRDARRGLAVSTPGLVPTVHRITAKILPTGLMMTLWELLRRA